MMARAVSGLAAALALAGAVGGCGKDDAPTSATPGERRAAIAITEPEHQREYRATRDENSLSRTFDVRGTAARDRAVEVVARCQIGRCAARAQADDDGRWSVRLPITTSTFQPSVKITAAYADDPGAGDPATIEVTLREPAARRGSSTTTATTQERGAQDEDTRSGGAPARDPRPTGPASSTDRPAGGARAPARLTMIGDSLAVGTEPYLEGLLPGWTVSTDAQKGRTLGQGMALLGAASLGSGPHVLAFSLFTNDGPQAVAALDAAVRESARRAGSGGCAIWATIVVRDVSYEAANRRLRALGASIEEVRVVDWAAAVRANPGWLAGDRVHGTPTGYRERARMYAQEAQACAG